MAGTSGSPTGGCFTFHEADSTSDGASSSIRTVLVHEIGSDGIHSTADDVAVEAPLEIRLVHGEEEDREERTICVTMRTPGADMELALGYLYAESVVTAPDDVIRITEGDGADASNASVVELARHVSVNMRRLERNVFTTSSCGACGAPSLDAVAHAACAVLSPPAPMIDAGMIHGFASTLRDAQSTFRRTGGLHAAALFDTAGRLLHVREDVGRHNALDKLIGACLQKGLCPLDEGIVLVSGRASYELVQKTLRAGAPILAAVGAPSSLAIDLAQGHDLTLLGFVRNGRYNVYHGEERLRGRQNMHSAV